MNYTREDVVKALGLEELQNPEQEQVVGMFLINLDQRVQDAVTDKLSDEQLDGFNEALKGGDDAAETWLTKNVSGYDQIEEQEFHKLVAETNTAGDDMVKAANS